MMLPSLLPFPSSRCKQFATAPFAAVGSVEIIIALIGARARRAVPRWRWLIREFEPF